MSLEILTSKDFETLLQQAGFSFCASSKKLKIAVAVSGGADSLALTILLDHWVRQQGGKLVALTVDHGLRAHSAQEATELQALLIDRGIEHHILTWQGQKPSTALQEKARKKRYELLKRWCLENGYDFLFLGHHQGDQNETYCMRLRQKSGLMGLACMRPLTKHQSLTVVRPFLDLSKERLEGTLKQHQIEWVEDPSNQNTAFERVFWRQTLGNTSPPLELFQRLRKAYEGWIARYLKTYGQLSDLGYVHLNKRAFDQLPQSFQGILLSFLFQAYGVGGYPLSSRSLSGILNHLKNPNFSATTAQGLRISKHKGDLLIAREYRAIKEEKELLDQPFIWDKRFLIRPEKGLKGVIKCVGEKGWRDLLDRNPDLKNSPIPRAVLWSLPALWVDGGETIHLTCNGIVEAFQHENRPLKSQMFLFRSKSPF